MKFNRIDTLDSTVKKLKGMGYMKDKKLETIDLIKSIIDGEIDLKDCVGFPFFISQFRIDELFQLRVDRDLKPIAIVINELILNDEVYGKTKSSHLYSDEKLSEELSSKLQEYSSQTSNGEVIPVPWTKRHSGVGAFTDESLAWNFYYSQHKPWIELEDLLTERLIQVNQAKDYLKQGLGGS